MFSDHLQIIDNAPAKKMLFVAAGLVLVCQLVAMALVAEGQVEKAHVREASQASFQAAMASCIESSRGIDLNDCARLVPPNAVQASASQSTGLLPAKTGPGSGADSQGLAFVTLVNSY